MSKAPRPLPCGDRLDCTGCGACSAACPKGCLPMQPDSEGFLFPTVDINLCIDCGLCDRICPIPKEKDPATRTKGEPLEVLAAWHLDSEIRRQSSSGGVFTSLADAIFAQGGVVVGAAFDEKLIVKHVIIENSADLHRLRGSKYVQSEIAPETYQAIRDHLKAGRVVLFSGVPCQVAGLKGFLRKPYPNLFTCDLICHGVPSPQLWQTHLDFTKKRLGPLVSACFRDKSNGWHVSGPAMRYSLETGAQHSAITHQDPYTVAFVKEYCLRESCYKCQFTQTSRVSDITLGDFWDVRRYHPEYDTDDHGVSIVIANTPGGVRLVEATTNKLVTKPTKLANALPANPMLLHPSRRRVERTSFYRDMNHGYAFLRLKYGLYQTGFLGKAISKLLRQLDLLPRLSIRSRL